MEGKERVFVMADVVFLPPSRGGRHTMPEGEGYSPYFRSESMSENLAVRLFGVPVDAKFDSVLRVEIELIYSQSFSREGLKFGERFCLFEGPKTVAEGILVSFGDD